MIRFIERLIFPLFFVTVSIGLVYWYWTTTPTYALSQIVGAVRNKDTETFEKYVDLESIAYRAIDDVLHGPAKESGMLGKFDSMIGAGIIGIFKPEIAEIARTQVLKFIESGSLLKGMNKANVEQASLLGPPQQSSQSEPTQTQPENPPSDLSNTEAGTEPFGSESSMVGKYAKKLKISKQLKAYGLSKDGFKGIDYIKIEGQTALVGFKFRSDKFDRNIIIEIKMEDAGGYWRVTELSNLNDLINTYLETRDQLESALPLNNSFLCRKSSKYYRPRVICIG